MDTENSPVAHLYDPRQISKAVLATALLEDQAVNKESDEYLRAKLNEREDEYDSRMSFKMWAVLWFNLGMLFTISILTTAPEIPAILKFWKIL